MQHQRYRIGIFCLMVSALASLSCQVKKARGSAWEEATDETLWSGDYRNCDSGYYVLLPDHIVGHSQNAPVPNHGFTIDLAKPDSALPLPTKNNRYISVWSQYNAAGLPTLAAIADNELRLDAESEHNYHILSRSDVKMATLHAVKVKASYSSDQVTALETKIISYRPLGANNLGDIVYVLSLVTNKANNAGDTITFKKVLAGFHLTALSLGACANDGL